MSVPINSDLHIGLIAPDLTMKHGWAQYSLSLIKALQKTGVRLTVVAARNSPRLEGIEVHPILPALVPRERGFTIKLLMQIPTVRHVLRNCDVIHALAEPYGLPLHSKGRTASTSKCEDNSGQQWS